MSKTLDLLKQLIHCPSITPNDAGCQSIIGERLRQAGFHLEPMRFGEVDNLWARKGTQWPLLVFAGHTDVVPAGPRDAWLSDPFQPYEREGFLYGRGAADMKSGLAAMIVATEQFLQKNPEFPGSIGFLVTSDEEGPAIDGTQKVIEMLEQRHEKIDYCVVGEATSEKIIGDQIRVGRRGSLNGKLIIHGKQGHVAFPHLATNAVHIAFTALHDIATMAWDEGNAFFPPTTFQISNVHAGTGALNIIPGAFEITFNFRFSTASTLQSLQNRLMEILSRHQLDFDLHLNPSAQPFLSKQGKLIAAARETIKELTTLDTVLSTGGGTSDARFIAPTGAEVIELGPCNASVHQANEYVSIIELEKLTQLYQRLLEKIFL
ncbi:succinyl-diaminopimelate desuccinylase [Gammaproteobacteria bacterium SCGC AG-212-F23]|nr:succinyl-diaminopimelate desuccinylase [Gammaproteobacteria bacterium SCGC AG-212-F23]